MKLKPGVVIEHKKKRYSGEIPDELFNEIYDREAERMRGKFELIQEEEANEP